MCAAVTLGHETLIVYLVTHLSIFKCFRVDFPRLRRNNYGSGPFRGVAISNLKKRMDQSRKNFAKARKLGTQTIMKTWGLASHGSLLASIITLHPSEMVEYTTSAHERSVVLFSRASLADVPSEDESCFDQRGKDGDQIISFPWEKTWTPIFREEAQLFYLKSLTFRVFTTELPDLASDNAYFNLLCARFLLDMDRTQFLDGIGDDMLRHRYGDVFAKLDSYNANPETRSTHAQKLEIVNSIIRVTESHDAAHRILPLEKCGCGERLKWDGTRSALCMRGHRWRKSQSSTLAA